MKVLRDMALFAAVGELQNFGRAADRLGMPTSSLSRRIAEMEEELGVRLLDRNTRRVRLTDEGVTFLESCQDLMQRATAAQDAIRGLMGGQHGTIRISLVHSFGVAQILPAIPKFCDRYQDISFEIDQSAGCITTTRATFDVAFVTGTLRDSSLVARRLCNLRRVLCASPNYLRHNFALSVPSDLQKLRFAALNSERRSALCLRNISDKRVADVICPAAITTHDETSLLSMVLAGAGVAALDEQLASKAITAGQLIRVMPSWALAPAPLWAVTTTKQIPQRVSLFLDFLSSELQTLKISGDHADVPSTYTSSTAHDTNAKSLLSERAYIGP